MIRSYRGQEPSIAPTAYIDDAATVIGDVVIGERSSVWPSATMRGDLDKIRIGTDTSIQEGTVIHVDHDFPTTIGNRVTVGHAVVLHGCTVEDDALIGIGAVILNGAKIGRGAVVAAGALVPEGADVPAETLVMGAPAKPRRAVKPEERERFAKGVEGYVNRAQEYLQEQKARR